MCDYSEYLYTHKINNQIKQSINYVIYTPKCKQLSKLFKGLYPDLFVYAKNEHQWYYKDIVMGWIFINNGWLISFIDENFISIFTLIQWNLTKAIVENPDVEFKINAQDSIKFLIKSIKKMMTKTFKDELCRELKLRYEY
jgi:hypothetical protein